MISIIIPTLNEAANLQKLIPLLQQVPGPEREVIIVDAESDDNSLAVAKKLGARAVSCSERCRAKQMNQGAQMASGEILYFVHADTQPPQSCLQDVAQAVSEGYRAGCFRFRFDSSSFMLRINSYFTRFDKMWCRGGDQTLFVEREVFDELGGFPIDHIIMEEYTFIREVKSRYSFRIIPKDVVVSARKYEDNSWLRVQLANMVAFNMYRYGASQQKIFSTYRKMIQHR